MKHMFPRLHIPTGAVILHPSPSSHSFSTCTSSSLSFSSSSSYYSPLPPSLRPGLSANGVSLGPQSAPGTVPPP